MFRDCVQTDPVRSTPAESGHSPVPKVQTWLVVGGSDTVGASPQWVDETIRTRISDEEIQMVTIRH